VDDYISFLPSASTAGELTLTGTLLVISYHNTSTIGSATGTLTYALIGTEASFPITVAASTASSAPTGSVNVYVDSISTYTQYPLTAATSTTSTATVNLNGLTAGGHTIAVVYPTTGQFTGSGSATTATGFSIAQAGTSVSWTPAATAQQVSQAVGTGVLNAAATPSVAGNFVYTATPSGGSASAIDASTYLPIGAYSLAVTFYPTDSTDYASSTGTVGSYSVTQATTTAAVGASTNVVAADGTGNFTNLSAALAALPVTGGTIYLKAGTYTGQNAVSYPNVFLRGLGGDPTKILLTAANGNFSVGSYPQSSGTPFGPGPAGKGGDEGSAVLDVSKNGYPSGSTSSPFGFYAEYLTIQNTYDTDTVNTSTTTASGNGGTCNFSGTTPHTLQYLYNNNLSCGSQAQALYMSADQAILNNVNLISQQDTLYAGYQGTAGSTYVPSRQYIWKGLIIGDVDYIYGDAALVLDHTNIFTTWHGTAANGTATITAQNKRTQTGGAGDYLSGYVCNACTLMSQSTGMTNLYYGRPYGVYSTFVLLNSFVDQVNAKGFVGWDGASQYLSTSTYAEYNTKAYTDPAVGVSPYPALLFGGTVIPTGGNTGSGATSFASRESSAFQLTAAQAASYYPVNFLSTPVSTTGGYSGMPTTWNPITALTNAVNAFASTGTTTTIAVGGSVTILGRPQTPGAGIIPTGTYTFYDGGVLLATGNLDASGEAYLITSSLASGTHYITMVYGGDTNFAGSTSSTYSIYVLGAGQTGTTTALAVNDTSSTVGTAITGTVTVSPSNAPGIVSLYLDGVAATTCTIY